MNYGTVYVVHEIIISYCLSFVVFFQYFDNMPHSMRVVFESTVELETILYTMVLLYGLLHLAYHLGKW